MDRHLLNYLTTLTHVRSVRSSSGGTVARLGRAAGEKPHRITRLGALYLYYISAPLRQDPSDDGHEGERRDIDNSNTG